MSEEQRQPFIFGVMFTLGEKVSLKQLLHQQFESDDALSLHLQIRGYAFLNDRQFVIDDNTGVAVEQIGIGIIGQTEVVGMIDVIDTSQTPRVKKYIDEAKKRKNQPFFSSIIQSREIE